MELVVLAEESEQGCFGDSRRSCSETATLKQVSDPVVYKLVRVDTDGKLVPATDDELLEVENLLELEKNEIGSVSDIFEIVRPGLDKDDSKTSEFRGSPHIKDEEGDEDGVKPHLEESLKTSVLNSRLDLSDNILDGEDLEDGKNNSGSTGSGPKFSLLKGEINLDKLTARELQETFRATFGRKTSVKDKMWLKRRIAMGLTNSCDVSVPCFVINDGKLLNTMDDCCNTTVHGDPIIREACSDMSASSGSHPNPRRDMEDSVAFNSCFQDSGCKSDDSLEHRAAKRVRKPTKRYIEESSDKDTNDPSEKSISPSMHNEQDKISSSLAIKSALGVNTGAFVTRHDSIGGCGVEVPYVSRVRRCRPRQSFMTLTKFNSNDVALAIKTNESLDAPNNPQVGSGSNAKLADVKSFPCEDPIASEDLTQKNSMTNMSDSSQNREPIEKQSMTNMSDSSQSRERKGVDSGSHTSRNSTAGNNSGTNSDDNVATVPTSKGGMRRKHHRAWSVAEVVKLVDGVSRFGPGRWSEIKRLSFSSYSYRTPVDLKDKWRNLLKASLSNPAENGMNPRTKAPVPIPAPILVKVRELAEMNGQAPQIFKATRDNVGSSVNEDK